MSARSFRIALIPGDGIGKEVVPAAWTVLQRAASIYGFELNPTPLDWSCETYLKTGAMMPKDGLDQLAQHDAIFLGAVGFPGVPDHLSLWGLLIPIRRAFDQYVNLRPVRLLPGLKSPLADKSVGDIEYWIVRENTEGEYSQSGGLSGEGTSQELVIQNSIFTRHGTDRILRYAFDFAKNHGFDRVTSATKSNGLFHSMPYWDDRFDAVASEYPDIETELNHVDILAARLVMRPEHYQVVVASNLFGDILSDLGPATTGTIAVAPSANLNPERKFPSMFEPVHGSAPDIAGQNIANPIGQIWSGAMMLEHLEEHAAATAIMSALDKVLLEPFAPKTRDIGGTATTHELADVIASEIQ